jgi:uncharacterized protein
MSKTIAIVTLALLLAAPAVAQAHVTLQPDEIPAGGFARLDVRVPSERDDASTVKVEVKFPPGFEFVSTEPMPGWTTKVTKVRLAKPITNDEGEQVADRVDTITWTGDGKQGKIGPGQFQDFGLSVGVPDEAGTSLTFKALQTYDDGKVVRWIGPPKAEEPAPQVKLLAASAGGHTATSGSATKVAAVVPANDADENDGAPTWLAVLALVVGALGLLAGIAGLMAARRRTGQP